MFGSNAPNLIKLIVAELKNNGECLDGKLEREELEITDLADEEKRRYDIQNAFEQESRRLEEEAKEREKRDRIMKMCNKILETFGSYGLMLAPFTSKEISSVTNEQWESLRLRIFKQEKINLKESIIEEILYFSKWKFSNSSLEEILSGQCLVLLMEPTEEINSIDEYIYSLCKGNIKLITISKRKYLLKLIEIVEVNKIGIQENNANDKLDTESESQDRQNTDKESIDTQECIDKLRVWVPQDQYTKALAVKVLFPKLMEQLMLDNSEPPPQHIAFAFDVFKQNEIVSLMKKYPGSVMRYGLFSNDQPSKAKLLAKRMDSFEKKIGESTL